MEWNTHQIPAFCWNILQVQDAISLLNDVSCLMLCIHVEELYPRTGTDIWGVNRYRMHTILCIKAYQMSLHQDALMLENMPGNQGIPHTKGQYCRKCVHVMASSCQNEQTTSPQFFIDPVSKVQGTNMGPIWGRQDPGGPHVGPINFAIWVEILHDLSAKGTNHMWHWVFFLWIFTLVCIYFFHCILTIEYLGW